MKNFRIVAVENESGQFFDPPESGRTGLNLTAADYFLHMDPWWNPAMEDQVTAGLPALTKIATSQRRTRDRETPLGRSQPSRLRL